MTEARGIEPMFDPEEIVPRVRAGEDPLGDALMRVRSADERRATGAIFTPAKMVEPMVRWAARQQPLARVVDHGCGSGRFLLAAGRALPHVELVGIEIDPLAALVARANLAAAGLADRAKILVSDFRSADLATTTGRTAFISNPPYVRHHSIDPEQKRWAAQAAAALEVRPNGLAGSHAHFMLAVATQAQPGDVGVFVSAADWLDTKSGCVLRDLVTGPLGGVSAHIISANAPVFDGVDSTAVVVCFRVGETTAACRFRQIRSADDLGSLDSGRRVARGRLRSEQRWSSLLRARRATPRGHVELGELARVSRGVLTGSNRSWVLAPPCEYLPARCLVPVVSGAGDLFAAADSRLDSTEGLRLLLSLPADLGELDSAERDQAKRFIDGLERAGISDGYVARQRTPWWALKPHPSAPILVSSMARQVPVFVRNLVGAAHLNIVYGLHPHEPMSDEQLDRLAQELRVAARITDGRFLAGGLAKFEPSDFARIKVPDVRLGTSRGTP